MPFYFPTFQTTSPRYISEVELDNTVFRFLFDWNDRESAWYVTIADPDENIIQSGIKLVVDYNLLKQHDYNTNLPNGVLLVLDLEDHPEDRINFDDFGTRWIFMFVSQEEIDTGVFT